MTATYEPLHDSENASMQVWRCASCGCFHLRAGQVLMTFTPEEFASFTQEIIECYCIQMHPDEAIEETSNEQTPLLISDLPQ